MNQTVKQEPKTAEYSWGFGKEEIALRVSSYWRGGGLAIQMFSKQGKYFEDFSVMTENLPGYRLEPGEAFISDFCSKEKLAFIKQHKLGKILPETGHSGYCSYAKVAFDLDRLAEFDHEGVEAYKRSHDLTPKEAEIKKPKTKKKSGQER